MSHVVVAISNDRHNQPYFGVTYLVCLRFRKTFTLYDIEIFVFRIMQITSHSHYCLNEAHVRIQMTCSSGDHRRSDTMRCACAYMHEHFSCKIVKRTQSELLLVKRSCIPSSLVHCTWTGANGVVTVKSNVVVFLLRFRDTMAVLRVPFCPPLNANCMLDSSAAAHSVGAHRFVCLESVRSSRSVLHMPKSDSSKIISSFFFLSFFQCIFVGCVTVMPWCRHTKFKFTMCSSYNGSSWAALSKRNYS